MTKPKPDDEDFDLRKDTWTEAPHLQALYDELHLNVAMVFVHGGDMSEIAKVIEDT